ncbi:MAG: SHOCT domain-containing protein [Firmicutes bacterium]|nr:SHOCT domain-containing protein [Bacillota bacterium]
MPWMFWFRWLFPLFGVGFMVLMGSAAVAGFAYWLRSLENPKPEAGWSAMAPAEKDPLEIARERYAKGLITSQEFDAMVERLLKTEREP